MKNFKPFLAYSASAGSGKTFALSVRYIALLFMEQAPSTILAATFTNKAAAEMRQRVVESLRELPQMVNDPKKVAFVEKIAEQTGLTLQEIVQKQPDVLAHFLASSSYIVTLDSFFSGILRSASLEIGIEPDFVTKTETQNLEKFFLEQLQTQGLLSNLVSLSLDIEDKRFSKILTLMQNFYKVDPLLPDLPSQEESLKNIEDTIDSQRQKIKKLLEEAGASQTAINNFIPRKIKDFIARDIFAKTTLLDARNYKKYVEKNPQIDEIFLLLKRMFEPWAKTREAIVVQSMFSVYAYYKNAILDNIKASGVLTFDDLSYFTYVLLHKSKSKEFLYFKIDAKFKHILLDEFQDTSTLQFLLLKPLIDEIFSGIGQSEFKSFFYVGDTKQSLYRFRGGVEELFEKVASHYKIGIEQMDTNYRSSKNVVESVNEWFKPIDNAYVPQKTKEGASDGYVEVIEVEDASFVVDEAVKQAQNLIALGVSIDDIAFLVSTNKAGQELQEACMKQNIETLLKTTSSLKNLPKISALVAMAEYLFGSSKIDAQAMLVKVGKSLETIDVTWFSPFMSPLQVLDRLVREFGYFNDDVNILKLLEFSASFNDIPSFVEEFETSSIPVASNSVHGANIMTIHGSKGLEFEYVIVLDRLTKKRADNAPLFYDYDENLFINKIVYRTKRRENFDTLYADILAKREAFSLKDDKNVLYVALTRAVEGLIVIRKEKGSIFDILAMQPFTKGVLEHIVLKETPKEEEISNITLSHYGIQENLLVEKEEDKAYDALLFGSALHYGLEMLASFALSSLPLAMVSIQNKFGHELSASMTIEIKKRIENLLQNSHFQTLLQEATILKEQSLSFEGELKKVDVILQYSQSNRVIEYKSSKKFHTQDKKQVNFYINAIKKITQKPTKGVIVYLLEDKIEFFEL